MATIDWVIIAAYFLIAFILSFVVNRNIIIALQSIIAIAIQFFGYGYGFLKSMFYIVLLNKAPKDVFPHLFFEKKHVK